MTAGAPEVFLQQLRSDASRLREGWPAPLDLEALIERLGLTLTVRERPSTSSIEATLATRGGRSEIVIWRNKSRGASARSRERFSIAHEIGHYCALRSFNANVRPRSKKAYWELEQACNDFAGRLLVADSDVAAALGNHRVRNPRQLLEGVRNVQRSCGVSLAVASHRVRESSDGVSISFLTVPHRMSADCVAVVQWCQESPSWLGYARRAHVRASEIAAEFVNVIVAEPAGATKMFDLDTASVAAQRTPTGILITALMHTTPKATERDAPEAYSESLFVE